jgi:hypothetical protein
LDENRVTSGYTEITECYSQMVNPPLELSPSQPNGLVNQGNAIRLGARQTIRQIPEGEPER